MAQEKRQANGYSVLHPTAQSVQYSHIVKGQIVFHEYKNIMNMPVEIVKELIEKGEPYASVFELDETQAEAEPEAQAQ